MMIADDGLSHHSPPPPPPLLEPLLVVDKDIVGSPTNNFHLKFNVVCFHRLLGCLFIFISLHQIEQAFYAFSPAAVTAGSHKMIKRLV